MQELPGKRILDSLTSQCSLAVVRDDGWVESLHIHGHQVGEITTQAIRADEMIHKLRWDNGQLTQKVYELEDKIEELEENINEHI